MCLSLNGSRIESGSNKKNKCISIGMLSDKDSAFTKYSSSHTPSFLIQTRMRSMHSKGYLLYATVSSQGRGAECAM